MHAHRHASIVTTLVAWAIVAMIPPRAALAQGVYVCVANSNGAMRYIGQAGGLCQRNETGLWLPLQGLPGPQGPVGPPGPPADLSELTARVAALEGTHKWVHFETSVDCGGTGTLAAALEAAAAYASADIGITGTCPGNVVIGHNNTRLHGIGGGAVVTAPSPVEPAVEIAAAGAVLDNLTIQGGVHVGGSVLLANCVMTGSAGHGIFATDSSTVVLHDSTVTRAAGMGIFATGNTKVTMSRSTISHNGSYAIMLHASRGFLGDGSTIEHNNGPGVLMYNGSTLDLGAISIFDNAAGVAASGGSSIHVGGGTNIADNRGHGIFLEDVSVVTLWGGETTRIVGNTGWGVACGAPPAVAQISGNIAEGVLIQNNTLGKLDPQCRYPGGL